MIFICMTNLPVGAGLDLTYGVSPGDGSSMDAPKL